MFGHAQGERPQSSSHVVGGGIAGIRPDMVAPSKRKSENPTPPRRGRMLNRTGFPPKREGGPISAGMQMMASSQCSTWEWTVQDEPSYLLRKEVIQPHLPVRLPCYDFTPITDPTFDSSLPKGLGHWLRVLPTFVV